MVTYDWRLSFVNLEIRDRLFTRLKTQVELMKLIHSKKVVFMSHSYGTQLLLYFLKWAESQQGGKGGDSWVDTHVHAICNIAGSLLGVPKSFSAILSGEMKDTSQLGGTLNELLEFWSVSSRKQRVDLFRTWHSLFTMLPIGGAEVWGDDGSTPEEPSPQGANRSNLFAPPLVNGLFAHVEETCADANVNAANLRNFLKNELTGSGSMPLNMSFGYSKTPSANDHNPLKWHNPLEVRLPYSPNLTIYSFYGVGKPTERGFRYRCNQKFKYSFVINTNYNEDTWINGVRFSEGDGTVPLISLGYLSAKQWRTRSHNPAGSKIITHEIAHNPHWISPRGGDFTGDHVDILGNYVLNEALVKIACGSTVQQHFISNIQSISEAVYDRLENSQ
ncbi:uncharacterized protein LOC135145050 isoform X2 [Zophobas morio]